MRGPLTLSNFWTGVVAWAVLSGCATTTVRVIPPSQEPVCDNALSAVVLWAPQWRPDQKDVLKREAAAETGLNEFLQTSGCFKSSELRRVASMTPTVVAPEVALANGQFDKVVAITLRELGPVVTLLSSLALIDGGTEVVFQVAQYVPPAEPPTRSFTVHWQNGGPGVIKGVASLPQDMQAALIIGLRPRWPRK